MKMYVWQVLPSFLAVAQASSVEEARRAVLLRSDLGESDDGSCPERDKAREFVLSMMPTIWYGVNAEFVLTNSAELREQEDYSQKLFKRVSELEADLAAAREDVTWSADSWRPVDLGPKGEWFMGRLKDGTEKPLRRLPDGSSYEYSDVNETYYSWYWLTHWRPLIDDEQAAIDSARAGGGKEPIRASGDCICSVCGKRYGDHPTDKVVLSAIDSLPFLHVLCDGARVKL